MIGCCSAHGGVLKMRDGFRGRWGVGVGVSVAFVCSGNVCWGVLAFVGKRDWIAVEVGGERHGRHIVSGKFEGRMYMVGGVTA